MPIVPLGTEAYSRTRGSVPEIELKNFYLEEDKSGGSLDKIMRLQRAGLTELVTFDGPLRGIFQMDGVFSNLTFVVAGSKLYSTDWSTSTLIGTVPDDGLRVSMAANAFRLGIVTGGQFWTYDGSTLAQIELPDGKAPIDLDVLNGYFLLPLASGVYYWLSPDQSDFTSADAILQYAEAEAIPDGVYAVRRLRDEFFLFGASTIEVWQPTGDANSTFMRAQGRTIDRGVQSRDCIQTFDNSVVFVGNDGLVYRITDVPERISTNGIEERITNRTDVCSAFTFTTEGHKFYCLVIPGQGTFAYDASTQAWSEFSTIEQTLWEVSQTLDTNLGSLAASGSKLCKIDPNATTDAGNPIERVVSGTVAIPLQIVANSHLSIWIGASADTTISIRWRDGRGNWSNPRTLTARAGSDIVNVWRLGATKGAFRTFEISTSAETLIRISGAMANEGRNVG